MLSPLNDRFFQYMTFSKDENKSIIYVSIFIALILNSFKILRIFGEVDTVGESLPDFTLLELIYQLLFQICFCYSIGFFTFKKVKNVSSYELFNVKTILTLVPNRIIISSYIEIKREIFIAVCMSSIDNVLYPSAKMLKNYVRRNDF